ncbi:hypothetical protein ACWD5V_02415 [Streptomyces sp. NPDC002523]
MEVPGSDLDSGLGRLGRHALALAHEPLDTLCDRLSAGTPPAAPTASPFSPCACPCP